jgi:outer membrane lipoprotein SlyB
MHGAIMQNPSGFVLIIALSLLGLGGCATTSHQADVYRGDQAQQVMHIRFATVLDVKPVTIADRNTGTGTAIGAVAGGVAAGGTGDKGDILGGIAGAVVGGIIGHQVEKRVNTTKGVEITYQLDGSNEVLALVQATDERDPIMRGDRIRLIQGPSGTRAERY